jgi:hypothetical protein
MKIASSYFYLEILGGIFSVFCAFLYCSDLENYILLFLFYMMSSLAFFISKEHSSLQKEVTASLIVIGTLQRTLNDQSITPWLIALSFAAIISLYILKGTVRSKRRQQLVHIILPASVWLSLPWIVVFASIALMSLPIRLNFYRKNIILLALTVAAQSVFYSFILNY